MTAALGVAHGVMWDEHADPTWGDDQLGERVPASIAAPGSRR